MDDRETRFDETDLTRLTRVQLEEYMAGLRDRREAVSDPFVHRSYDLRMAEVGRAQRELTIRNRRETERQDALPPIPIGEEPGDGVVRGCPVHDGAVHGGEAEELRAGIEEMITGLGSDGEASAADLQRLLDRVNARDSLGYLERQDVTADEVRAVVRTAAMTGVIEAIGRMMGPTYWYDNPGAHETFSRVADGIAARVAEQLASRAVSAELSDLRQRLAAAIAAGETVTAERDALQAQREADLSEAFHNGASWMWDRTSLADGGAGFHVAGPTQHRTSQAAAEYARSKVGDSCV